MRGYHPKLSKNVLIVHPENIRDEEVFCERHGFKVCTGGHYLGGYIEYDDYKSEWLRECILTWEKNICMIGKPQVNTPRRITPQWYV